MWIAVSNDYFAKQIWAHNINTGAWVDETEDAKSTIANDVGLPPYQATTVGDAIYIGDDYFEPDRIRVEVSTAGVYSDISLEWQYWNGSWTPLPGVVDGTSFFTLTGKRWVRWTRVTDWEQSEVNGVKAYWLRCVVTGFGAAPTITTNPLATQILNRNQVDIKPNPNKISIKKTATLKALDAIGDYPFILSMGKKPLVLTMEGRLYQPEWGMTWLEKKAIFPLEKMLHRICQIWSSEERYKGTYIMNSFTWTEEGGAINTVKYKLEFYKGKEHLVVIEEL